jgi:hypothetical protein
MLWVVQCSAQQYGDSKVFNAAITKLHALDVLYTCEPHLIGGEVFGSQKCKADVFLCFEYKSHWPDKVNFSRPCIVTKSARANQTNCSLANVAEELSSKLQEDHASNNLGTTVKVCKPLHVTTI